MTAKSKQPLDKLMVARGLAPCLQQARPLIMAGKVIVDDHLVDKPGTPVSAGARIRIKAPPSGYVSRGGDKLAEPLRRFRVPVAGRTALDVGASTGGFSDCLLQHGASRIFAVDVGYGQLAWKLQQDERVISMDRTNIRTLPAEALQPCPDLAVVDASFTSLKGLLPHVAALIAPGGEILALVKPQFEVPKAAVEKGGIVRDLRHYQQTLQELVLAARKLSLHIAGIMESPIRGAKGNREFFIYLQKPREQGKSI